MPNPESDFTLEDGVLRCNGEARAACWSVKGPIINSVTKHTKRLRAWKEKVACAVKAERGGDWCSHHLYAVTLQFCFRERQNPAHEGDLDNYVKPVLDGLAAGLFLPEEKFLPDGSLGIKRFDKYHGVDDSNFRILLIRRLPNAESPDKEGVRLFVSTTGHPPPG